MTTAAENIIRSYEGGDQNEFPVIASDIIYEGSAVGENASGYARPLVAGDPFLGFALEEVDNSAGAAGALNVKVRKQGSVVLPISAVAITSNDQPPVYASDDNTFTLTAGANSHIGWVARWISTGYVLVQFDTPRNPSTIETGNLAADAVTGAKLADDACDSEHYTDGSIDTAHVAADAIDATLIADDAIDSEHYTDGSIDTAHVAADAIDATLIADNAVSLEHLDAAITPSHILVYCGTETTTGGNATEAHTITGLATSDFISVTIRDEGTNTVYLLEAVVTTNTLTVQFSADPGNDCIYNYQVFRTAA